MSNNKKLSVVALSLAILALMVSGCASAVKADQQAATKPATGYPPAEAVTESPGNEIASYADLVDALEGTGAEVEPVEEIQQPFFDANGQVIKVNGADVQVFEFAEEAARQAASEQISPDGSSTGTTMITWVDQPNFWANGQLIVLYVGKDAATIDLLSCVLGEPITSHE